MQAEPKSVGQLFETFERKSPLAGTGTYLAVSALALFLPLAFGLVAVGRGFARRPDIPAERMIPGSTLTASEIFLNNARIVLVILVGGVLTLSLGAFLVHLLVGVQLGRGIGFLVSAYGPTTTTVAVVPHGVFEVAAYVVAGGVALRVAALVFVCRERAERTRPFARLIFAGPAGGYSEIGDDRHYDGVVDPLLSMRRHRREGVSGQSNDTRTRFSEM